MKHNKSHFNQTRSSQPPSDQQWSIGLYQGDTPFSLRQANNNPIIKAQNITDLHAQFVADPFMIKHQNNWYLFFETLPLIHKSQFSNSHKNGVIGMAKSTDGFNWHYQGTVLHEPWHLSYPYIFEFQGEHYMLPETLDADCIRLYKAANFPTQWVPVADLLSGKHADPTIFYYQEKWWMFSCPKPEQHDTLELHYAEKLFGPWKPHPLNPIIKDDARIARPAGRVIEWDGQLFRFAQDCYPRYGSQVRAFEITEISSKHYEEKEHPKSPILSPTGQGWNGRNMHHIDLHLLNNGQWRACVDGYHLEP